MKISLVSWTRSDSDLWLCSRVRAIPKGLVINRFVDQEASKNIRLRIASAVGLELEQISTGDSCQVVQTILRPPVYNLGLHVRERAPMSAKWGIAAMVAATFLVAVGAAAYRERSMKKQLTPEEERVIVRKGTERPFTGKYYQHFEKGVYTCRRCGSELFESSSKFRSDCGWPSFDEQIPGRVKWQPDADGMRTEIICANCGAHLGHVFLGEHFTEKNTRYCVNSISMDFIPAEQRAQQTVGAGSRARPDESKKPQEAAAVSNPPSAIRPPQPTERAIFASGCFWGTEYYMQQAPGVISTTVGFTGGHVEHPTYEQVCTGRTGHAESVEVVYDPSKTSYEQLAKLFFETHDFTQLNRQGPDIGTQYRSAIFYLNDEQRQTAERLVRQLRQMGYNVRTQIAKAGSFWPAEDYHQDYYNRKGDTPYCHIYRKIFDGGRIRRVYSPAQRS